MRRLLPSFCLGLLLFGLLSVISPGEGFAQASAAGRGTTIWYDFSAIPFKKVILRWLAVVGFTWLIGESSNYSRWNSSYWLGAVMGSIGFFLLLPLHLFNWSHLPLSLLGSALPEWGSILSHSVGHSAALNPLTASALVPFLMLSFLLSYPGMNWFTVGTAVGFAAMLSLSVFMQPSVMWIGSGFGGQLFLAVNAAFCLLIAYLGVKTITDPT